MRAFQLHSTYPIDHTRLHHYQFGFEYNRSKIGPSLKCTDLLDSFLPDLIFLFSIPFNSCLLFHLFQSSSPAIFSTFFLALFFSSALFYLAAFCSTLFSTSLFSSILLCFILISTPSTFFPSLLLC